MSLKIFATKDEVPADLQASAIETKDGKFVVEEAVDTSDLETSLETEKRLREAAEKLTRKTAAELQKLQTQKKAADAGMTEERLKELRAEARAEVEAELAPRLTKAEQLEKQNRALVLDAVQKGKALKLGVLPEKIDDFWALRGSEFDLTDDGKPMVKGKPGVDPDKHLESLLKKNPEWVAGSKASGGGAAGIQSGGAPSGPISFEELIKNPSKAIAAGNAKTA